MRGREYSDRPITGMWLGPKNGVRLPEVFASRGSTVPSAYYMIPLLSLIFDE